VHSHLSEILLKRMTDYAVALDRPRRVGAKVRRTRTTGAHGPELRGLEKVLVIGNWLYQSVRSIASHWRTDVLEGKTPYSPDDEAAILDLYRRWAGSCRRCLVAIETLRSEGAPVRGSKAFERHCEQAARILQGDDPFFDDVARAGRWAAITARAWTSTRPVRVDEQGRIFETTGQRFVMPGLTPEDILQGMADVEAGRTESLEKIIAARGQHGIPD
jgi:hypothetical protein